jgi:MerR family transcriptional regulator, light-induced transcriptional regulator
MKTYSIQMTSYLSGVSPDCIRAWERRYQAIVPDRDKGRRVFDDTDVARLLMLKELSSIGNPISTVARLSNEELSRMCAEMGISLGTKNPETVSFRAPEEFIEVIFLAFDSRRFDILHHELVKAADELSAVNFVKGIMSPLLARLDSVTLTDVQRRTLFTVFKTIMLKKLSARGETIAIAAYLPGENNNLKSIMSALLMSHTGMNIYFAGECDDLEVLIETAKVIGARVITLESSSVSQARLAQLREKVESLMWNGEFIFQST